MYFMVQIILSLISILTTTGTVTVGAGGDSKPAVQDTHISCEINSLNMLQMTSAAPVTPRVLWPTTGARNPGKEVFFRSHKVDIFEAEINGHIYLPYSFKVCILHTFEGPAYLLTFPTIDLSNI